MIRWFLYFSVLLISVPWLTSASKEKAVEKLVEQGVTVVTRNNLEHLIQTNRILLILCYTPWDRNYQEKIGDYEKAAKTYEDTKDVTLAKLDMAADSGAAAAVEVRQEKGLQYVFYRKGVSYNFAGYSDGKSLATKLKTVTSPSWTPPEIPLLVNRVKEIAKNDFVNDLTTKAFAVVLFYKPSSLASQRVLYDFELAAGAVKILNGIKQGFFKFDADAQSETMAKYGVMELPAFKLFRHGKVYDYNGPMVNPQEIKTYITSHLDAPFTAIPNPAELEAFLKKNADRSTVVGFFAALTLAAFPNFVQAAETLRDRYNFVLMSTPMVSNGGDAEPQQAPGWTLAVFLPKRQHTPDDEKRSVLQYEEASYEMIVDFIKWKATPLAGERTRKNAATDYSLRPLVVIYSKVDWTKPHRKETEYLRDKVASAAKDHKDTLFSYSDSTEFAEELARFGFDTDSKYDLHVGILGKDGEYYPRWDTAHMSAQMISDFVKQHKDGDTTPYYRSNATASLLNSVAGVKELTGETFKPEILDSASDALVLFYHPLSKYWKLAQSILKDLAEDVGYKRQKIVFAEMDVSTNDAPAYFRLPTFPVIYFVPKDDKLNPTKISGDICGEYGIRQFLKQQLEKSGSQNNAEFSKELNSIKTEL